MQAVHQALVRHVPPRARNERVGLVWRTAPARVHGVTAAEAPAVVDDAAARLTLYEHGGALWNGIWIGDRRATREDLVARFEGGVVRGQMGDQLCAALSMSPLRGVGLDGMQRMTDEAILATRVVDDGTERAAAALATFVEEEVRLRDECVMVRSSGPLARFVRDQVGILAFPRRDWDKGLAIRPDRAGDLWSFLCRPDGRSGQERRQPPLPRWFADFPADLFGDEDVRLYARLLLVWTDAMADNFGRRLDVPGFAARMRAGRKAIGAMRLGAHFGVLPAGLTEDALRACAGLLAEAGRTAIDNKDRLERWSRSLDIWGCLDHADYATRVMIPRLHEAPPMDRSDAEALAGIGG